MCELRSSRSIGNRFMDCKLSPEVRRCVIACRSRRCQVGLPFLFFGLTGRHGGSRWVSACLAGPKTSGFPTNPRRPTVKCLTRLGLYSKELPARAKRAGPVPVLVSAVYDRYLEITSTTRPQNNGPRNGGAETPGSRCSCTRRVFR